MSAAAASSRPLAAVAPVSVCGAISTAGNRRPSFASIRPASATSLDSAAAPPPLDEPAWLPGDSVGSASRRSPATSSRVPGSGIWNTDALADGVSPRSAARDGARTRTALAAPVSARNSSRVLSVAVSAGNASSRSPASPVTTTATPRRNSPTARLTARAELTPIRNDVWFMPGAASTALRSCASLGIGRALCSVNKPGATNCRLLRAQPLTI